MLSEKEKRTSGVRARRGIRTAVCLTVLMTVMFGIILLRGKNAGEETSEENTPEEITSGEGMISETAEVPAVAESFSAGATAVTEYSETVSDADEPSASSAAAAVPSPEETVPSGVPSSEPAAPSVPAVPSTETSSAADRPSASAASAPVGTSAAPPPAVPSSASAAPSAAPAASAAAPSSAAPGTSAASSSAAEPPPHRHSYRGTVTQEATCGAAGVMTYVCACGASRTETIPATGLHDWIPVTAVIHHDAETHTVHHNEQRHRIVDVPAYDEYVYELHAVCSGCGMDLTLLERENGTTPAEHSWQHYEKEGVGYGWHDEQVVVGSVHHDEQSHEEVIPAWDETVVDRDAWDETVISAYRCAVCGAVKD